ncbi:MAG: alkaline phosphatase family protein [Candidatus Bathyarchaeia archaeon]
MLYLVLDGAADKINGMTPLEEADVEGLSEVAKSAKCGLQYSIGRGIAPESDVAVLSILGYNPHEGYTGRGPLEALGIGVRINEGKEIVFRGNFATVDPEDLKIIDRRSGRDLSSREAKELSEALNSSRLNSPEEYFRVYPTNEYRNIVVFGSKLGVSDKVSSTDPAYIQLTRISVAQRSYEPYVKRCVPLEETEEALRTAKAVNTFTEESVKVLDNHPVNCERASRGKLKANCIILRQPGGSFPKMKPINEVYGLKFGCIAEMAVEKGVAKLLGMEYIESEPVPEDPSRDLTLKLNAVHRLMGSIDVLYVHLKEPDERGHDGDFEKKVEAIETIDRFFVRKILNKYGLEDLSFLVTSDHATPWRLKTHSDDPIPFMVASKRIKPDGIKKFCERECSKGSLGILEHGWLLLPLAIRLSFS